MLREEAGRESVELDVPAAATAAQAVQAAYDVVGMSDRARSIPVVTAVNREQVSTDAVLAEGDEVAVLPPVSGGAPLIHAAIVTDQLSADRLHKLVSDPRAGAVVTFHGVTRAVERLDYDAYPEMAQTRLETLLADVVQTHDLIAIAAEHRIGAVPLGESSVIVAASSGHRPEAFAGARAAIDRIKLELPIWKRESGPEGGWVDGSPIEAGA